MIAPLRSAASSVKRAVLEAWHQVYADVAGDYSNTTFLAGSGRGGTTWIAELINHANDYRFMFEPFYARFVPVAHAFRNRQYLRPDDDDAAFLGPANAILEGRVRNKWIDAYNHRLVARKRLIKEIRANLFLRWLDVHFPKMAIVLLMRHPFGVATSRLRHNWSNDLADFLKQDALMVDHLEPFRDVIESTTEPFERHVLQWCIENWVPLRQFGEGEIHIAFYENFNVEPRAEIGRLFAFLGQPFPEEVLDRVDRPSTMTWARAGSGPAQASDPDAWRPFVSREQVAGSLRILARFGLDAVYADSPLPNRDAALRMLSQDPVGPTTHA